jgi:hypothetical protein
VASYRLGVCQRPGVTMTFLVGLHVILDPGLTALLVRCGLNRRPLVSRPLSPRKAADPASLREGRPAVCAVKLRWPANQPCLFGRIGPLKPLVPCLF